MEEENKEKESAPVIKYDSLEVYEGAKFKTLLSRSYRERKHWVAVDPTMIKSFIPGMIRKVYVKEGQRVKKGEKLCSLEAMKMLNEITTSIDGIVKTVHVKVGVNVANHQVLVELEKVAAKKKQKK
jgi:biotin carboxyl carrier protein